MTVSGDMLPICQMFVTLPRAGMHANVTVPVACRLSSAVGSSNIFVLLESAPKIDMAQDATKPSISMPASASAVLAATAPAATQLSSPSFSSTVTKTSIVDFGKRSSRRDGSNDCSISEDIVRSSASWVEGFCQF